MNVLNIFIDKNGRNYLLDNNQQIVIAKSLNTKHYVISKVFSPFGYENPIIFSSKLSLFFTTTPLTDWCCIKMKNLFKVQPGQKYSLNNIGFSYLDSGLSPTTISLLNKRQLVPPSNSICGLSRYITSVDESKYCSVSAYSLPFNQSRVFILDNTFYVFIASGILEGMLLPKEIVGPSNANASLITQTPSSIMLGPLLKINISKETPITFDVATASFIPL